MKDVTLYGHLTIDTILEDTKQVQTLGSMANVWKSLLEIDNSIKIGLSPIDIGEALIYIDKEKSQRYSKATLNLKSFHPKIISSKINHLIYINEMTNTDFIKDLDGIVTADICPGKKLNLNLLQYIDYLFISDEDVDDLVELENHIRGYIILHSSTSSFVTNGFDDFEYHLPKEMILQNVNVLGAGDIFASCFLYKLLRESKQDIKNWIEFAHIKTTEIIRNSI
jgi:sugar/nucleoside kinase (ribokinase family)